MIDTSVVPGTLVSYGNDIERMKSDILAGAGSVVVVPQFIRVEAVRYAEEWYGRKSRR